MLIWNLTLQEVPALVLMLLSGVFLLITVFRRKEGARHLSLLTMFAAMVYAFYFRLNPWVTGGLVVLVVIIALSYRYPYYRRRK